ncbi:MAG: hypothetical protein CVV27_00110 [Candidatus Melainabacteria bacterium HGW-Melainabacteria-1]|nr:MAG: hypothetical protein CVV27_00110 [Candidatus Melainabacteria bacterium HGW-Melainabacteria-1]
MILLIFLHGLRVSELAELTWGQFALDQGDFHVRRKKCGKDSTHPLSIKEIQVLRKLQRLSRLREAQSKIQKRVVSLLGFWKWAYRTISPE